MKQNLFTLLFACVAGLFMMSCSPNGNNDPELNAAPEAVVELSQYAGEPVDLGLSVYWRRMVSMGKNHLFLT